MEKGLMKVSEAQQDKALSNLLKAIADAQKALPYLEIVVRKGEHERMPLTKKQQEMICTIGKFQNEKPQELRKPIRVFRLVEETNMF
jgi:hypothetical protein